MTTPTLDYQPTSRAVKGGVAALTLLICLNLFNYIDRQVLAAVEPAISVDFGKTQAQMGVLATAFLVVYMILAPVFGPLADRTSRWTLVGVGMLIQTVATLGSGLAGGYGSLLFMRCLVGAGDAAYGVAAPTIIADRYPVAQRGRMLAWFYAAIPVGSAIGYGVGGVTRDLTGNWRNAFFVIVPPMTLLGVACFFFKDVRKQKTLDAEAEASGPLTPNPGAVLDYETPRPRGSKLDQYKTLLRTKSYLLCCAGMTMMTFAIGGISFWLPRYLEQSRGRSPTEAGLGIGAVIASSGLIATLAGGWLGDRLRPRYPGSYFLVSGAGLIAGFPLLIALLYTPFPYAWPVIWAACFCLFFNTGPANTIIANVTTPNIRATAFAANIFVIHALGDAISPTLIGVVADRSNLSVGFVVVGFAMLIGGGLWLFGARYLEADTIDEDRVPREGAEAG